MIKAKENIENLPLINSNSNEQDWRLKLDENENIYGVSNIIISAIKNMDFEKISQYPKYDNLINKLSEYYNIPKFNIALNTGDFEALINIFNTYLENEDEVLSFYNLSKEAENFISSQNAKIKNINDYEFNIEILKKNISNKAKLFYISTPDNNTGKVVRASILEELISKFENILFIINCSYINYTDNVVLQDYMDLAQKYDNVAIIKSFSNDFALAGLRLGFLFASENIINNIRKTANKYSVNSVALQCGCTVLNNDKYFEEIKTLNRSTRKLLFDGLAQKGFRPYESEANFILCDFFEYCDFYYQKLKNSGVIVKRYDKSSPYATCLRITVPKMGGVKYILELLNKKDMLIFDLDGVVFDIRESYHSAIIETFKHFAGFEINRDEIYHVKNLGGFNCDWNTTKYLLEKHGYYIDINDIARVFQDLFFNPEIKGKEFLIDKEKLLISKEKFEELSKKYDLVIFTGRFSFEMEYSLKKFDIDKFFHYAITADDLDYEHLKPNPEGILRILKHCPHKSIKYIGDSVDDIIAGNKANITTIGTISPGADESSMINNFRHLCANYILKDINNIVNFINENEQK